MEEENDLSVTELKEIAAEKARIKAEAKEKEKELREKAEEDERNKYRGDEMAWGMAEDATEENNPENPDMSKNPFSLDGVKGEELNLEDPKRTLRGWFEREGFELEYDCQEKGKEIEMCINNSTLCKRAVSCDLSAGSS